MVGLCVEQVVLPSWSCPLALWLWGPPIARGDNSKKGTQLVLGQYMVTCAYVANLLGVILSASYSGNVLTKP